MFAVGRGRRLTILAKKFPTNSGKMLVTRPVLRGKTLRDTIKKLSQQRKEMKENAPDDENQNSPGASALPDWPWTTHLGSGSESDETGQFRWSRPPPRPLHLPQGGPRSPGQA